jgi:hypothetical protein
MRRLENFGIRYSTKSGYCRLYGNVYNHPYRPDGQAMYPSIPTGLDRDTGIITTSSSSYLLVNPLGDLDEIYDEIEEMIKNG